MFFLFMQVWTPAEMAISASPRQGGLDLLETLVHTSKFFKKNNVLF